MSDAPDDQALTRRPIPVARFLALSVAACALATGFLLAGAFALGAALDPGVVTYSVVTGFVASTSGWLVLLRGFNLANDSVLAHLGAGMLTKLVLLLAAVALLEPLGIGALEDFFIPFAAVFFLTGFAQLFITLKGAIGNLEAFEKGRSWPQPAAPGMSKTPEDERPTGDPSAD